MSDAPADLSVVQADLWRDDHARAVTALTAAYAQDAFGNGGPLAPDVLERLIPGLRSTTTAIVFLAYLGDRPVGLATCFRGFSTFRTRPLINVHDLSVLPEYRGRGIGRALLGAVAARARALDCCAVSLEVQANNQVARRLYEQEGFAHALAETAAGGVLFFTKRL